MELNCLAWQKVRVCHQRLWVIVWKSGSCICIFSQNHNFLLLSFVWCERRCPTPICFYWGQPVWMSEIVIPQFDWLCDVCGCVMSPTSGIYWVDLGFINNYKESQLWLIILRYSADVASAFSLGRYIWYQSRPGNLVWAQRHYPTKWALTKTLGI